MSNPIQQLAKEYLEWRGKEIAMILAYPIDSHEYLDVSLERFVLEYKDPETQSQDDMEESSSRPYIGDGYPGYYTKG